MSFSAGCRYRDERRAIDRRDDPRCRVDPCRQVGECALLRVEHRPVFGRVRDLEDDAPAGGIDEEILIALAASARSRGRRFRNVHARCVRHRPAKSVVRRRSIR